MRKSSSLLSLAVAACWLAGPADAAVIIKTIRCAICVTDDKHPDACKKIAADGHAVVSEEALRALEGELGQGATIMMATAAAPAPASGGRGRHRRGPGSESAPQ